MIETLFEGYIVPDGKWLKTEDGVRVKCSNCGKTPITKIIENTDRAKLIVDWTFNDRVEECFLYCPFCGANNSGKKGTLIRRLNQGGVKNEVV